VKGHKEGIYDINDETSFSKPAGNQSCTARHGQPLEASFA